MSCSVWNAAGFTNPIRLGVLSLILLFFAAPALRAQDVSTNLSFANGKITCEILFMRDSIPALVLSVLPIAMNTALEHVGAPAAPTRLTIRLQEAPSFYQRAKALFHVEAFAIQQDDEILLRAGEDPLKLAFRIAHELSHWLVSKRYPIRPPLWLDEGLASLVGAAAADTCARTRSQSLDRPQPPQLEKHLYRLDELIALASYPTTEDRSAAFYWQAEALVKAIRGRLGPAEFAVYLELLSSPGAPDWRTPLRERWYFSDWDFNWLAQQIHPDSKLQPAPDADK